MYAFNAIEHHEYYEVGAVENWHMASHTLLKDVNEILFVLFTFIAQFWRNMA
jgi:hypothetical protein